jgi:hypothetical protein
MQIEVGNPTPSPLLEEPESVQNSAMLPNAIISPGLHTEGSAQRHPGWDLGVGFKVKVFGLVLES